ncbi:uncharacterized protein LOC122638815 [Telopea speciosissima]|uniref:uncharacterized protein LOC122638815 n=1 Tax=Telopea speciosissima TaxID=54955 RepID=UPI001CC35EEA|nr:uncharacterized protein LOC122638815 [Telopea speciosissima]
MKGKSVQAFKSSANMERSKRLVAENRAGQGWDSAVFKVEEIQKSSQFIHLRVITLGSSLTFFCTAVYASNSVEERRELWRDVLGFASSISSPWMALGDFNIVRQQSEKFGGDIVRQEAIDDFNSFIFDTGLVDLEWKGELFTWNNRQGGSSRVCCKLDRAMVNLNWLDVLRSSEATFLPPGLSDHSPAVVSIFDGVNFGRKPFRFFEAWIGREGFDEVVAKGWESPVDMKLNPTLRFAARLRNVKIQTNLAARPTDSNLVTLETAAKKKLWEALSIEEKFLKEKSRITNIQLGDDVGFFPEFIPLQHGLDSMQQISLIGKVSNKEIKEVVFAMKNSKAPGPDGFGAAFFKHAWEVVGEDLTLAVKWFFSKSIVPSSINATFICLIPKTDSTSSFAGYRPIALCNLFYKIITKILSNRLQGVVGKVVSDNQSAFIKGRSIVDNILVCHDVVRGIEQKGASPMAVLKIDLHKAYDALSKKFLFVIMERMGFPAKFIQWVKACVDSPCFSILLNGSPTGYFKGKRGIRQGDPLSPYLFTIAMEGFTALMQKLECEGRISLFPRCKSSHLSHLIFADDLMVFVKAAHDSVSAYCSAILDLVRQRLEGWKARFLSFAGRLQLLTSVLQGCYIYWSGIFALPGGVKQKLESMFSNFLWTGPSLERKVHYISWDKICKPKDEGGLGIRRITDMNITGILKQIWWIASKKDSLWVRWVYARYLKKESIWTVKIPQNCSWVWRKVLKYRHLVEPNIHHVIGSGHLTRLWLDNWHPRGVLIKQFGDRIRYDAGSHRMAMVSDIIRQGTWQPTSYGSFDLIAAWGDLNHVPMLRHSDDLIVWKKAPNAAPTNLPDVVTWLSNVDCTNDRMDVVPKLDFCATMHYIWWERNCRLFENKVRSHDHIIEAIRLDMAIKCATLPISAVQNPRNKFLADTWGIRVDWKVITQKTCAWFRPPTRMAVLHCEGSLMADRASYGGIIRDAAGIAIIAYAGKGDDSSVLGMELYAILKGVDLCIQKNLLRVSIRSDSKLAVDILNGNHREVRHVWRELNQPADFMAAMDTGDGEVVLCPPDFPQELVELLKDDFDCKVYFRNLPP